jgi:integrase
MSKRFAARRSNPTEHPMHDLTFASPLANVIAEFIASKRAIGYQYKSEVWWLRAFDRYLLGIGHTGPGLPRKVVERWTLKRSHEAAKTHHSRVNVVRQLAQFMLRQGRDAYVPPSHMSPVVRKDFRPWIFTRGQVAALLAASSALPHDSRCPLRHLVMPELFRVLYSCGPRCGEVVRLLIRDVDLRDGVLTIRQGKFRQDRLVPVAPGLLDRLRVYAAAAAAFGPRPPEAIFFPAPHGGPYSVPRVYDVFRRLLRTVGIPHGGRGVGPRVHDLRATFAVHRIEAWCREGADLGVKLPILAKYMGHVGLAGTQHYLRLTPTVFPYLAEQFEQAYGHLLPRLGAHEAD